MVIYWIPNLGSVCSLSIPLFGAYASILDDVAVRLSSCPQETFFVIA